MTNKNYNHVKEIADALHEIATQDCYLIDGELITGANLDSLIEAGEVTSEELEELEAYGYTDRIEPASMYDYFNDVYDIEYSIGGDGNYRGVRLMVAFGGPNIYVNTRTREVELYWWSESAKANLSIEAADAIDEVFNELYSCR